MTAPFQVCNYFFHLFCDISTVCNMETIQTNACLPNKSDSLNLLPYSNTMDSNSSNCETEETPRRSVNNRIEFASFSIPL